ncbi:uncharacterized protein [Argopecten irradians]|uniref:uncharacterized protein n=1 Tax=Argopecten irradians TaxID=31199 RepID=UPI0037137573
MNTAKKTQESWLAGMAFANWLQGDSSTLIILQIGRGRTFYLNGREGSMSSKRTGGVWRSSHQMVIHAYLGLLSSDQTYILPSFPYQCSGKWEISHGYILRFVINTTGSSCCCSMDSPGNQCAGDSLPNLDRAAKFVNHWRKFMEKREKWATDMEDGDERHSSKYKKTATRVEIAVAVVRHKTPAIMLQCHVASYRRYALKQLPEQMPQYHLQGDVTYLLFWEEEERENHVRMHQLWRWCHKRCLGMAGN